MEKTSSGKKTLVGKLWILVALLGVFAAAVGTVIFLRNALPGFYASESGRYSVALERDGSCNWYQDGYRFSGSYEKTKDGCRMLLTGKAQYSDTEFEAVREGHALRISGGTVQNELFIKQKKPHEIKDLDRAAEAEPDAAAEADRTEPPPVNDSPVDETGSVPIEVQKINGRDFYLVNMESFDPDVSAKRLFGTIKNISFYGDKSDFAVWVFDQPIENCVALSIPVTITAADDFDYSDVRWGSLFYCEEKEGWYCSDDFNYQNGTAADAVMNAESPMTVKAITVVPLEAPNGCGSFYFYTNLTKGKAAFITREDAEKFVESVLSFDGRGG